MFARFGRFRRWSLTATVMAVALVVTSPAGAVTGDWSPRTQVDRALLGRTVSAQIACPGDRECVGISAGTHGPAVYSFTYAETTGVDQFGLTVPFGSGDNDVVMSDLQCPSTRLCVGVADYVSDEGDDIDVVTSTSPGAGPTSWIPQRVDVTGHVPAQLSCPTPTLCVGAGIDGGIVSTQHPTGGGSAWSELTLTRSIVEVTCPSTRFCAALDSAGNVWTSTSPAGPSAVWLQSSTGAPLAATAALIAAQQPDGIGGYADLSCSGPQLCVAVGAGGDVLVSTDPQAPTGDGTWTAVPATVGPVNAVHCVTGSRLLCLAGDDRGDIATSTDPSTPGDWTTVATQDGRFSSITCSARYCMATGTVPLRVAIPPSTRRWQWQQATTATFDRLNSVSCPVVSFCLAAGTTHLFRSLDPAKGAASWVAHLADDQYRDHAAAILDTSCASARLCFAVTDDLASGGLAALVGGDLFSFNPAAVGQGFSDTKLAGGDDILFVTCAQGTCVAGLPGHWYETSDPSVGASWEPVSQPQFDVTCVHANAACLALAAGPFLGTAGPDLLVAAHRSGPWRTEVADPGQEITGLACTRLGACVIVDQAGHLLVSRLPVSPAQHWHLAASDPDGFDGVACETAERCVAVDGNGGVIVGRP